MINFMKEGEFVRANDVYLLTAIGNAPWPIGLTMVGIHERSGMVHVVLDIVSRVAVFRAYFAFHPLAFPRHIILNESSYASNIEIA